MKVEKSDEIQVDKMVAEKVGLMVWMRDRTRAD